MSVATHRLIADFQISDRQSAFGFLDMCRKCFSFAFPALFSPIHQPRLELGLGAVQNLLVKLTVLRDQTWNRCWNRLLPKALQKCRSAPPKSLRVHIFQQMLPGC